ncbi:MAG: hypothetical protein JXB49_29300 [Bacteroidales bacterium]|nr:hypothetical protein [Bacteroidales bacterium]
MKTLSDLFDNFEKLNKFALKNQDLQNIKGGTGADDDQTEPPQGRG